MNTVNFAQPTMNRFADPHAGKVAASFLLTCWLLLAAAAQAHQVETITSFGITNYTGYVIAGDSVCCGDSYNREHILARAVVQYSTTNNAQTIYNYQIVYRLLDGTNAIPLRMTNGTTSTNLVLSNTVILPAILTLAKTVNRTYVGALAPAVQLDPYRQYTVEVRLLEATNGVSQFQFTGDSDTDGPAFFRHFASTSANDAQFNVIPVLSAAPFSQTYAVDTVPGKDAHRANVSFQLHRYDSFLVSNPGPNDIPVVLDLELRDAATGVPVPLAMTSTNLLISVEGHDMTPSSFFVPAVENVSQTVLFKPAASVQLDPLKFYRGVVTIRHRETLGGPLVIGNSTTNSSARLLHFNGDLFFGSVQTRFTSIDNIPGPAFILANGVQTFLGVDNQSGFLVNAPNHTYGNGDNLSVLLRQDGTAFYLGGNPVEVTEPNPDTNTINGIRFARSGVRLDTNSAVANIIAWYPTGFGVRPTIDTAGRFILSPYAGFLNVRLNGSLNPVNSSLTWPTTAWGCEETKPFWFKFTSLSWDIPGGRFVFTPTGEIQYTRAQELAALVAAPVLPSMKRKPSNEGHFALVKDVLGSEVVVSADPARNSARMTVDLRFGPGDAISHFPYASSITWSNFASVTISNDLVNVGTSALPEVGAVEVAYTRDCTEPDCAGGQGVATLPFKAASDTLYFTKDGGLTAKGVVTQPQDLTWGWINGVGRYAHRVQAFTEAGFHMPGFFLRGDEVPLSMANRPAALLFTGIGSNSTTQVDFTRVERPNNPAYVNGTNGGFGDYAGLNFRVVNDGNREADSTLAAKPTGFYPLTGRSKYYLRKGGVSGIHEAVFSSFPPTNNWYGYAFQVSNFGLAFRDSQNVDSRTEGSVFVKHPSVVTQAFERLMFNCLGGLEKAQVPAGEKGQYKELEYWKADFIPLAITFERKDGEECDPGKGKLVLGVQAHAQPFPDVPLFGNLGFETNGNLITKADGVLDPDFDSRLKLPSNLSFTGPANEKWHFTPVNDAYFNNYEHRGLEGQDNDGDVGWLNIAGKLDAPFYEDLQVHMHCSPDKDSSSAKVYLMGGWPSDGYENFFTQNPADIDNAGRPHAAFTPSVAGYRSGSQQNDKWRVRAKRLWLDVVDFDYPLHWDSIARAFRSAHEETDSLLVLSVQHQINYLSPENADISFGAQYTGVPQLNIANIAYDQLGGLKTAVNGVLGTVIDDGMEKLEETLSAQTRDLFRPVFNTVIRPRVQALVADMRTSYSTPWTDLTPAINKINSFAAGGGNSLTDRLKGMTSFSGGTNPTNLVKRLRDNLALVDGALQKIQQVLAENGDSRPMIHSLMQAIVGHAAPDFVSAFVPNEVNDVLKQLDPTLDQLSDAATKLREALAAADDALNSADFSQELFSALNSPAAVTAINVVVNRVKGDMLDVLEQFDLGPQDSPFSQYDDQELTDLFMQKIEDRFFGSVVASELREVIKHRLYDLDASIRQTTDSVFQQVNVAVRDVISEMAQQLSNEITPMLGKVSALAGAGKINGYAHINGDDLKELRIDAYAQLKVPTEMEFHGFLLIRELNSDNTPTACLPAGGEATEVTLGADNIPVKFANTDARLAVQAKFTLDGATSELLGIAGGLDLDGKLVLGPATISKLSAALAFGEEENYFSAACAASLNSYSAFGGIFFGRTCTLDPFKWDPQVQKILGQPPFTGAYVYFEAMIPVSEALLGIPASCMFQVSAGVGMGAGFFLEGPTFVGKAKLAVSGDFLCVASIYGDIIMAGKKGKDGLHMLGSGTFEVELCAIVCVSASKTVEMQYKNGSWDVDF